MFGNHHFFHNELLYYEVIRTSRRAMTYWGEVKFNPRFREKGETKFQMFTYPLPFFVPYKVSKAWAAKLRRRVLNRAWLSKGDTTNHVARGQLILERYRARLDAFEPYWALFRTQPGKFLGMKNCQTSYYVPVKKHQLHVCNSRLICPWCYSRWVSKLYEKIEAWLFRDGSKTVCGDLVWGTIATQTFRLSGTPGMSLDRFRYLTTLWYNNTLRSPSSSFPSGMAGWFGWFEGVPQQDGSVVLRVNYVGVADSYATVMTDNRIALPKRSQIVSTLVRLLSYKPGWVRCDPELFSALLEIQWSRKSCRSYGAFTANARS